LKALVSCAGVTGVRARDLTAKLHDVVDIPWDVALEVYANHDLPRYTAMCRAHLRGYDDLSPHCKGSLFSLVLNRGASFDVSGPRYAEMRDIKAAIKSSNLAHVPALLHSMKRIWKDTPDETGYRRREKEAMRWEQGLAAHHPEQHERLGQVAPVPDPELVTRVQQQLKNIGLFQVGSGDGSMTLKGRTEGAILDFRNRDGLPLTPTIFGRAGSNEQGHDERCHDRHSHFQVGDPSRTRTCNPRSRNPLLYPVELWDRLLRACGRSRPSSHRYMKKSRLRQVYPNRLLG
jgi:hypothetical protein